MSAERGAATRPPTVFDVARQAGVSAQTVSRYLRGFEQMKPSTRERVRLAVETLGYRPNQAARLLRTRQSSRIGALVRDLFAQGPGQLLRGASEEARRQGYTLSIVDLPVVDAESIGRALAQFREEQVAGILAVTMTDNVQSFVSRHAVDVPILLDPAEASGTAMTASESGGLAAARHLIDLGHRRLGYVGGPPGWFPSRERRMSFFAATGGSGGAVDWEVSGDWTPASGYAAAEHFPSEDAPSAVFCANDAMAIGFMRGLADRDVAVPHDVSVIGFDDEPAAAYTSPSLTTIHPDFVGEGRAAFRALLARVDGHPVTDLRHPSTSLRQRESTAPHRS